MTTVFIGGSRTVSRLNSIIRAKLDDLINRQCMIFVGDANGADKAVQTHLASRGYEHVLVHCMEHCRNNLGRWPTKHVATPSDRTDFAYYVAKDLVMAHDAKCGMMLWDGKSKGTLNNIQQIIGDGKKALVYLAPEKTFYKLLTEQDLQLCSNAATRVRFAKPNNKSGRNCRHQNSCHCIRTTDRRR
jgi:hypothetical protein